LKFLDSRKDPIVHRVHNVLLTPEVFFRCLDRGVPQEKLYLFEIPAGPPAQFRFLNRGAIVAHLDFVWISFHHSLLPWLDWQGCLYVGKLNRKKTSQAKRKPLQKPASQFSRLILPTHY
jgi:hypothetical protein